MPNRVTNTANIHAQSSLRRHLTLLLAVLALVPAVLSGLILDQGARSLLRAAALRHMTSVAATHAWQLSQMSEYWRNDLIRFTDRKVFRERLTALVAGRLSAREHDFQVSETRRNLSFLTVTKPHTGGYALVVDLRTGAPLVWAGLDSLAAVHKAARAYPLAALRRHATPWLSPAHPDPETGAAVVDVVQTIEATGESPDRPVAALIWQVDLTRQVYPYLNDRSGLGRTGEVILVSNKGLVLKDLRYQAGTAFVKYLPIVSFPPSVRDQPVTVETRGYQGKQVLAAYQRVPKLGWIIIAEMDRREAYAGLGRLALLVLLVVAAVSTIGCLTATVVARRIARPILDLSGAARRVAEGDLSVRVQSRRQDELGLLARDFNQMTAELGATRERLEELVAERTAELTRANEELKRVNQEMSAFTYSVSHDLSSPLVSLQGLAGLLLRDYADKLDEKGRHRLRRLQANVQAMEGLVADLLELSRIGRVAERPTNVDIGQAAAGVAESLSQALEDKGIQLDLPNGDCPQVRGDATRIKQVLGNLLSNAVKYMGEQPHPRIAVRYAGEEGGMVRLAVEDNGIGIDPAFHERIFMPFQRLSEVKDTPGTGIGLAIVRKIVTHYGGRVWVESQRGQGATFFFTLPKAG